MHIIAWFEGPEDVIDGTNEGELDLATSRGVAL
jgi:hypothetical protein